MKRSGYSVLLLAALVITGCAGGLLRHPRTAGGWTQDLEQLGIAGVLDNLAEPRDWRVRQVSSADPCCGGNDTAYRTGPVEGGVVLADLKGPGCVLRIWTREPSGTLYLYVDDCSAPAIQMPFADLFGGYLETFSPPFAGRACGGYYSYIPMPFEKHCNIMIRGNKPDLQYEVSYAEFPENTQLRPFDQHLNADGQSFFRRWREEWARVSEIRFVERGTEKLRHSSRMIWQNVDVLLGELEGPGTIVELEMSLASKDPEILRKAWLAIYWDGQSDPCVLAPVGDFFGSGVAGACDYSASAFGKDGQRLWCRFPMPFASRAKIRVINNSAQLIDLSYNITWRPGPIDNCLHFHARYNEGTIEECTPYTLAAIQGQGHFVGCNLTATGKDSFRFLEAGAKLCVDDETTPGYRSVATDAYFNVGWYFSEGAFSMATHGCTVKAEAPAPCIAAYRLDVTDAVPFAKSFQYLLGNCCKCACEQPGAKCTSVAYWYQREPHEAAWPIPGCPPEDGQ